MFEEADFRHLACLFGGFSGNASQKQKIISLATHTHTHTRMFAHPSTTHFRSAPRAEAQSWSSGDVPQDGQTVVVPAGCEVELSLAFPTNSVFLQVAGRLRMTGNSQLVLAGGAGGTAASHEIQELWLEDGSPMMYGFGVCADRASEVFLACFTSCRHCVSLMVP